MANKFIPVPAESIRAALKDFGYVQGRCGSETTFTLVSPVSKFVSVVVYTSITEGAHAVRAKDSDAIRVATVVTPPGRRGWGVFSQKILRVNSVAGVLDRVLAACTAAEAEGAKYLKVCGKCGGPAYSDSGRCVERGCREGKQKGAV